MAWAVSAMIGAVISFGPQPASGFIAVHDRHLHIHQNQVELAAFTFCGQGEIECDPAVFRQLDLRAGVSEQEGNQPLIVGAVFRQQQAANKFDGRSDRTADRLALCDWPLPPRR